MRELIVESLCILLGHRREVPALLALHQVVEALDPLLDRDEVREESAEPPLIDEVHSGALRFLGDRLLRLLLCADKEDLPAVGGQVPHEDVGLLDARQRLLKVDDVDPVPLHEDEALHLRVPAAGLMSEVDSGLEELLHRDDGHVCVSLVPPPATSPRGTGRRAKYRASCSISINSSWLRMRHQPAGPVRGSGPCPRRTLPTFRVVRFRSLRGWVPGAPAARAQPARPCHRRLRRATRSHRGRPSSSFFVDRTRFLKSLSRPACLMRSTTGQMAKYDEVRVPRGTSRRWEVLMSDDSVGPQAGVDRRTAKDVRAEHRVLLSFSDADLAAMPLVAEGTRLSRAGWYLDLHDPAKADFLASGDEIVEPGQHMVARREVSGELWDELLRACDGVLGRPSMRRLRPAV